MSQLLVGGAFAATSLVALVWFSATRKREKFAPSASSGVAMIATKDELMELFDRGGKAVVYLTAEW
jgi:hypothetical protein